MKAVLELEVIGDNLYAYRRMVREGKADPQPRQTAQADKLAPKGTRPWVARITGLDAHYGLSREFVRFQQKDYTQANSVGSRGVFVYYTLDPGVYEVNERVTWQKTRRYFIRVDSDTITEITREEVLEWLKSECSASTS